MPTSAPAALVAVHARASTTLRRPSGLEDGMPRWVQLLLAAAAGLATFAQGGAARAELPPRPLVPADFRSGGLLLGATPTSADAVARLPAPLLHTDVRIEVDGIVARATVTQHFFNPSPDWLEGTYVFPLPEGAAVDRLRLRIGDRFVDGRIDERAAARQRYDAARDAGARAALIEQERPNIFMSTVANIGPGEDVIVQVGYRETVRFDDGRYTLRVPLVVAPRFVPPAASLRHAGEALAAGLAPAPLAAARIAPPLVQPGRGHASPVTLSASVAAGMPLAEMHSPSHALLISGQGTSARTLSLADDAVPADRDFVLEWRPAAGAAPTAAVLSEERSGFVHALVMVMPPDPRSGAARQPREVVFVIDTSGSMSGQSIAQAQAALALAIDRLGPDDRFNVVRFSDDASTLFPVPVRAHPAARAAAQEWVRALIAQGGTRMDRALELALDGRVDSRRLRQIVFITDGAVGNEDALFGLIVAGLGDSRLFTVGIGSAPNGHFLRKAAQHGGGTHAHVANLAEVAERMGSLLAKIETPVLTDIAIAVDAEAAPETWPKRIPDLYAGEPVVATVRHLPTAGPIVVTGRLAGRPWRVELPPAASPTGGNGSIAALWARAKVDALLDTLPSGADPEHVRRDVIATALAHDLVTRWTSLVAVDVTPARPEGTPIEQSILPTLLPQGWDPAVFFPTRSIERPRWPAPQRADGEPVEAPAALVALANSESGPALRTLPQGATSSFARILAAIASFLLAGILLLSSRKVRT
ncbi:MAG: marine proteobacterial sortase target protein [Alphaproteobacteria bacterium]|nr:marine proteobacterial sortase target protein [Alphaproteobacteria bacterium]